MLEDSLLLISTGSPQAPNFDRTHSALHKSVTLFIQHNHFVKQCGQLLKELSLVNTTNQTKKVGKVERKHNSDDAGVIEKI